MFPLKRFEDQSVKDRRTEVSSRPSQTQVAASGVEQVTGADDHSDTATYVPDCGPETDEGLETSQLLRLEIKRTLTETKEEMWRETHGLGREIREMMQGMGREMREMHQGMEREMREMQQGIGRELSDLRQDMGCAIQEMQQGMGREMSKMQKEVGREMIEMQKEMREEMSEMLQKDQDISTTASHAVISNLTSASGRSTEERLQDVTTHLTDTGTNVFFNRLLHVIFHQRSNKV